MKLTINNDKLDDIPSTDESDKESKKIKLSNEYAESLHIDINHLKDPKSILKYILELNNDEKTRKNIGDMLHILDEGKSIDFNIILDDRLRFLLVSLFSKHSIAKKNWSGHVHQSRSDNHPLKFKKKSKSTKMLGKYFQKMIRREQEEFESDIECNDQESDDECLIAQHVGPTDEELATWQSYYSFDDKTKDDPAERVQKYIYKGYKYDEASGYYLNTSLNLYYDPTTDYYYDIGASTWMQRDSSNNLVPITQNTNYERCPTYIKSASIQLKDTEVISRKFTPSQKYQAALKRIYRKEKRVNQSRPTTVYRTAMQSSSPEEENIGNKLLKKFGWQEGEGLGKNKKGIKEPIEPTIRFDRSGIGHQALNNNIADYMNKTASQSKYHENVRQKTLVRFQQLK